VRTSAPRELSAGAARRARRASPVARARRAVLDDLFPQAPERLVGAGEVAAYVVAFVALIAASVLRQTGVGALDTIWAEDGVIFLDRALEATLPDAVGEGYAGYLHVVPRIAAEVVSLVPLARAATATTLAAAGIVAAGALLVYAASAGHLRSRPLRSLLAAVVVVHPLVAVESLNALALVQWPLTYAAFWLALWRPARTLNAVLAGIALFLIMVSAPLAVIVVPVLLVRVLVVPGWRDRVPALLFAVGLAVQVWAALTQPSPSPPTPGGTPAELAAVYRILVATPGMFGFALAENLRVAAEEVVGVLALAGWAVVVATALLPGMQHRLTALVAAVTSPVAMVIGVYARNSSPSVLAAYAQGNRPAATRFAVVPALLLVTVLALALDRRPLRVVPPQAWRQAGAIAMGALLMVCGMDYFVVNDRSGGPGWSPVIVEAVVACRDGATEVRLQTAPPVESWQFEVPCSALPP